MRCWAYRSVAVIGLGVFTVCCHQCFSFVCLYLSSGLVGYFLVCFYFWIIFYYLYSLLFIHPFCLLAFFFLGHGLTCHQQSLWERWGTHGGTWAKFTLKANVINHKFKSDPVLFLCGTKSNTDPMIFKVIQVSLIIMHFVLL